jgi:hypothetical protein
MMEPFMMIFAVAQWLGHLSSLHNFDELVDKITAYYGAWVMEVETRRSGLKGRPVPMYPSPEGSPQMGLFSDGLAC